jgi:hypothetical protein
MSDGPDNRPTHQLPAVPEWAIELTKSVKSGFAHVENRIDSLDGKVDTLTHGLGTVTDEVSTIKVDFAEFKGATNAKFEKHSIPIREASQTDMRHDAAIGSLVSDMADVKKRLASEGDDSLSAELKKAVVDAAKPWAPRIVAALCVAVLAAITLVGVLINQKMAAIQSSTDKAPSVIVVPLFDAGGSDASK